MKRFEYDITKHPADKFSQLVYYCTEQGECNLKEVPAEQFRVLRDILAERGSEGWELVQLSFGSDGIVAFWKRAISM